ncbi:MAG: PDZ domain-containing protein [Sphingomonas sp.]
MTRLEPRQRALIAGGVAASLAVLLLFSLGSPEPAQPPPAPVVAPPPTPVPTAAAAAPASAASPEGLRLHGVLGAGAVIGTAGDNQRFVSIGREAAPGLVLERIGLDHVMLRSAAGLFRLDFAGATAAGPAAPATAAPSGEAALRAEALRYRLGLAPRQQNGQVTGHVVRPNAPMPALELAGVRPGDVIVSVNGSRFDQERMLELAWTMANSDQVAFEVERGGRRIQLGVNRNDR